MYYIIIINSINISIFYFLLWFIKIELLMELYIKDYYLIYIIMNQHAIQTLSRVTSQSTGTSLVTYFLHGNSSL